MTETDVSQYHLSIMAMSFLLLLLSVVSSGGVKCVCLLSCQLHFFFLFQGNQAHTSKTVSHLGPCSNVALEKCAVQPTKENKNSILKLGAHQERKKVSKCVYVMVGITV